MRARRRLAGALVSLAALTVPVAATTVAQHPGGAPGERGPVLAAAVEDPTSGLVLTDGPTSFSAAQSARFYATSSALLGLGESGGTSSRSRDLAVTAKGTRLWSVSQLSGHGLPASAERAYRRAAAAARCPVPWTLLAGIGRVESDHGRFAGSRLGSDGVSRPRIFGLQLNGAGPVAAIRDTDAGRLDRDPVWDRAVGPMQFIPSTWATAARDGDGDGRRDPHDLDDAAAAAASYLCAGGGDLRDRAAQAAALHRYNQDDYYVALVQAFEVGYRTGDFVLPEPPAAAPAGSEAGPARARRTAATSRPPSRPRREQVTRPAPATRPEPRQSPRPVPAPAPPVRRPAPAPAPETAPSPTPRPAPRPDPVPSPSPTPEVTSLTGALVDTGGGYAVGGTPLRLPDAWQASHADELAAKVGTQVRVTGTMSGGVLVVATFDGAAV